MPPTPFSTQVPPEIPSSPPPSFRSRASSTASPHHPSRSSITTIDRTLEDTFGPGDDSDNDIENGLDDRQRLIRDSSSNVLNYPHDTLSTTIRQTNNEAMLYASRDSSVLWTSNNRKPFVSHSSSNDGVFANLNAKPERGEKIEEQPPVSDLQLTSPRYAFLQ